MCSIHFFLFLLLDSSVVQISSLQSGSPCYTSLDVIIALDASGSVLRENWEKSVDFVGKLTQKILALNSNSRIGVVDFSAVANEAIRPTNDLKILGYQLADLIQRYQNGITRTELALYKSLVVFGRIHRGTAQRLLIVVTDGQTTPLNNQQGVELLAEPTKKLKGEAVHIVAVGVGNMANEEELKFMATDPDNKNVIHISNYDKLVQMVDAISQIICPTKVPSPTPVPTTVSTQVPTLVPTVEPENPSCAIQYEKMGCFKDDMKSPRPLPELLFTDRDPTTKQYSSISVDWQNWNTYIKDIVCRCAEAAAVKNYKYFSIQYFGECWSGSDAGDTYKRNGPSDTCITMGYAKCDESDKRECAGQKNTNFVYSVNKPACPASYTKKGCFADDMKNPRPLPELLFADRDPTVKKYTKIPIDWKNWDSYIKDLVCRCAKEAKARNYLFFSIQYYGECWSGPDAGETYRRNGPADTCITIDYAKCDALDLRECVGKNETNFVYGVYLPVFSAKCNVAYHKLGCYQDKLKKPRVLPELILTDRDPRSVVTSGISVDWGNWNAYLPSLVCRCAQKASEKRFNFFGVQYYGECWSGPEAGDTYNELGAVPDRCVTYNYAKCPAVPGATDKECSGTKNVNYVYAIKPTADVSCSVTFKGAGCFKDRGRRPRPLPELLTTDLDMNSKQFSGISVNWGLWNTYLRDLVCRCAERAKGKRYSYFSIQNYGKCWSGPESWETFDSDGSSPDCVGDGYKPCDPLLHHACVGKEFSNYVYTI